MDEKKVTRAGYVAVIGRPNVGKSTLVNTLLEQKIAAVSSKPQTTRRRQLGILTLPEAQVIFVDTPGLHIPQHKLGDFMNQNATDALLDADIILWLLDSSMPFTDEDKLIADKLKSIKKLPAVWMALTKCDLVNTTTIMERKRQALDLFPAKDILELSVENKQALDSLLRLTIDNLPEGDFYFDPDTITDAYERDIAGELIRESVLMFVRDEVPHCVAVKVDSYEERPDDKAYIEATLFVERESQKGILVGKGGEMIKKIGTRSRQEIESMSGRKVFLNLKVQVNKNWRNSPDALSLLGYESNKE
ncbi:MAG: GTPase Era [Anaerolineaceae bacterium]|nr:GTPase Era [Anaerolineaceae bacterium]